jgi:hypothetical protein
MNRTTGTTERHDSTTPALHDIEDRGDPAEREGGDRT